MARIGRVIANLNTNSSEEDTAHAMHLVQGEAVLQHIGSWLPIPTLFTYDVVPTIPSDPNDTATLFYGKLGVNTSLPEAQNSTAAPFYSQGMEMDQAERALNTWNEL